MQQEGRIFVQNNLLPERKGDDILLILNAVDVTDC
jgi:hypothetical protein